MNQTLKQLGKAESLKVAIRPKWTEHVLDNVFLKSKNAMPHSGVEDLHGRQAGHHLGSLLNLLF